MSLVPLSRSPPEIPFLKKPLAFSTSARCFLARVRKASASIKASSSSCGHSSPASVSSCSSSEASDSSASSGSSSESSFSEPSSSRCASFAFHGGFFGTFLPWNRFLKGGRPVLNALPPPSWPPLRRKASFTLGKVVKAAFCSASTVYWPSAPVSTWDLFSGFNRIFLRYKCAFHLSFSSPATFSTLLSSLAHARL